MRVFVGVHASVGLPEGPLIHAATQLHHHGPWVLPAGPATHAFLAFHDTSIKLRLDGKPPISMLDWDWHKSDHSEARWELNAEAGVNMHHLLEVARKETHVPYDVAEAIVQSLPLPSGIKTSRFLPGHICTRVVTSVLMAAGSAPASLVKALPDLFPETLARALANETGAWLTRLPTVES